MPLSWNSYWYRFVSAACLVRGTELNIYKNWCACAQTLYRGSCHTLGGSSASWNTEASLRTFSFLSTQKFDRKGVQHLPIANYYFAMMSPALWQKPKRSPMARLFSRHPTKAKPLTKQGQRFKRMIFTFHGGAHVFFLYRRNSSVRELPLEKKMPREGKPLGKEDLRPMSVIIYGSPAKLIWKQTRRKFRHS